MTKLLRRINTLATPEHASPLWMFRGIAIIVTAYTLAVWFINYKLG